MHCFPASYPIGFLHDHTQRYQGIILWPLVLRGPVYGIPPYLILRVKRHRPEVSQTPTMLCKSARQETTFSVYLKPYFVEIKYLISMP